MLINISDGAEPANLWLESKSIFRIELGGDVIIVFYGTFADVHRCQLKCKSAEEAATKAAELAARINASGNKSQQNSFRIPAEQKPAAE